MTVPNTLDAGAPAPFTLTLSNFEGPFDLLLTLISRRKLDITDIALAEVTDEFLTYIKDAFDTDHPRGHDVALNTASEFLVTAATLIELKTARLLPRGDKAIQANPELLEARDLLFARLLQYRAYREVTAVLAEKFAAESHRFARTVALEPAFAQVLPELVFDLTPQGFAEIAARALRLHEAADTDPEPEQIDTGHIYHPATTIAVEEAEILSRLQQATTPLTFTDICERVANREVVAVRFLAVLELYKQGLLDVSQEVTLGPITLTLTRHEHPEEATHV
ncbi:segregation and condensation protein A [Rothia nasimurium]|uniref:segregation and condensation protein A n=1 Tax=Rothia nasimurium TaxID=85336 RepID=UPI001F2D641E|nr:ScpA family protein [Rothia nasimurium]